MSIVEKFMTMEYGPAPEDPREALRWLDVTAAFWTFHKRRVAGTHGRDLFRHRGSFHG